MLSRTELDKRRSSLAAMVSDFVKMIYYNTGKDNDVALSIRMVVVHLYLL